MHIERTFGTVLYLHTQIILNERKLKYKNPYIQGGYMKQGCMKYKGYYGTVNYSISKRRYYGEVLDIDDLYYPYVGNNLNELELNFHNAVNDYIQDENDEELKIIKIYLEEYIKTGG